MLCFLSEFLASVASMRGVEDKSDCVQNLRAASTLTLSPGTPVRSIGSFVTQVSPRRKISHHEMR